MRSKKVRKTYLMLTRKKPRMGMYIHYMQPSSFCPKVVSRIPESRSWLECKLNVSRTKRISVSSLRPTVQGMLNGSVQSMFIMTAS
eukprot:757623-Hanusia_phi.AAC.2